VKHTRDDAGTPQRTSFLGRAVDTMRPFGALALAALTAATLLGSAAGTASGANPAFAPESRTINRALRTFLRLRLHRRLGALRVAARRRVARVGTRGVRRDRGRLDV